MSNLFIIGNGFDIAHGLPTKYSDFHNYLLENYTVGEATFDINSSILPDGDEVFDNNELVTFLVHLISETERDGENWCDIERSLGRLNFDSYFDDMSYIFDEEDLFKQAAIYEDVAANFLKATKKIRELFFEWVNTIDISEVSFIPSFYNLINPERDLFLTFNYTYVLEEYYDAELVEHIHGTQWDKTIIGHGENGRDFDSYPIGTEWSLAELHDLLRKNTNETINNSIYFFDNLGSVKNIYSFGFSFSDVDLPYIREICKRLDTKDITWFLNDFYYEETEELYKHKIKECGFKGEFNVFSIKENSSLEA
ncbi:bacteriophage abortive infection AbiH family protein [Bacillus atrophaeus]|uniref:bacteriophage abortive infection AbiH family protein n=1 Tax=Bacillus atrophaeus TaxID=1452 RepID=UPI00227E411B|nr:bacteriophage abortive infection AbiH family protein [Bacillus atrophaeus]MCY8837667.1 bacteriophage abortive infection AbiH family protein [Bacillus atrophaeus]